MQRNWTLDRVMRYVLIAAAVAVSLVVLNYLSGVLFPFFAAFLIAYIMDPLVCRLQIKFRYRVIAVVVVLLGAAVIIGGCMYFFVPKVVHEVQYLGTLISRIFTDSTWSDRIMTFLPADTWASVKAMISWNSIAEAMESLDVWSVVQTVSDRILPGAWDVLSKTSTIIMGVSSAAVVFMYLVFIMLDMHKIRKGIRRLIPRRYRREAGEFASATDKFMGTYFRAQSMVAFTVGVLYAIGFSVMGLPMGMAFGLFSGALNMIPYIQLTTIPLALLLAVVYSGQGNAVLGSGSYHSHDLPCCADHPGLLLGAAHCRQVHESTSSWDSFVPFDLGKASWFFGPSGGDPVHVHLPCVCREIKD